MAHVRPGKTAKRNRRLGALGRLRTELSWHEWAKVHAEYDKYNFHRYKEIKAEIATLESRI